MRLLACGSRTYSDREKLFSVLGSIHTARPVELLIHGGNRRGADALAQEWGYTQPFPTHVYPADWRRYGKAAGPIRNREMLREGKPDLVVAFLDKPLSLSAGTADMVYRARQAYVETLIVDENARGEDELEWL